MRGGRFQPGHEPGEGALAERQRDRPDRRRGTPRSTASAAATPARRRSGARLLDDLEVAAAQRPGRAGADAERAVPAQLVAGVAGDAVLPPAAARADRDRRCAPALRSMYRCRARSAISTSTRTTQQRRRRRHDDVDDRASASSLDRFAGGAQPGQRAVAGGRRSRASSASAGRSALAGPGDVDLVGRLGHLGQHRDAVRAHRQEPAVHGDPQRRRSPSRSIRTIQPGASAPEQRRVAGQDAELALGGAGEDRGRLARTTARCSTETSSTCMVAIGRPTRSLSSSALRSRSSMPPHMKNACSG